MSEITVQAAVSSENCSLKVKPRAAKNAREAFRSLTGRFTKIMRMKCSLGMDFVSTD
ncbi:hypothetical protein D9M70_586500 [compost metagenome]